MYLLFALKFTKMLQKWNYTRVKSYNNSLGLILSLMNNTFYINLK